MNGDTYFQILSLSVACMLLPALAPATPYYVATNGSDTNPGTLAARTFIVNIHSGSNSIIVNITPVGLCADN